MSSNTLFIGKNLVELPEIPSTNSYLMQLLEKGPLPEGTVILAHAQTQGRGQRNNAWESAPLLNFTGSILLCPHFLSAREQFRLNMAISLGVCNTIQALVPAKKVKIKWPNDIYIENKKVAGLLIENMLKGSFIENAIIGIGININQVHFNKDLPNPTSLKLETEKEITIKETFELLCSNIEAQYLRLKNTMNNGLYEDYTETLYKYEEWGHYLENDKEVYGCIIGVDGTGRLLMKLEHGEIKSYDLKELRFLL